MPQSIVPIGNQTRTISGVAQESSNVANEQQGAKYFVWIWGAAQVLGGILLAYFADKVVTDPVALATLKPLLIFFGFALGITYIAIEFQIDGVLSREIRGIRNDLAEQRVHFGRDIIQVVGEAVGREMADLRKLLPTFNSYLSIDSEDSFGARDRILDSARQQLDQLARGEFELEGDDYYDWLKDRLTKKRPSSVRAISFRPLSVYSNDPREKNFIQNNTAAISTGTTVQRIFVIDEAELLDGAHRSVLHDHFVSSGAQCYVVWRSSLSSDLISRLGGGGLSIYDTDHVFYDRSYFARKIGDDRAPLSNGAHDVIPKAVVYSQIHPEFRICERLFDNLLLNFVDPAQKKLRGEPAYKWCCEHIISWASANSHPDSMIEALRNEVTTGGC